MPAPDRAPTTPPVAPDACSDQRCHHSAHEDRAHTRNEERADQPEQAAENASGDRADGGFTGLLPVVGCGDGRLLLVVVGGDPELFTSKAGLPQLLNGGTGLISMGEERHDGAPGVQPAGIMQQEHSP